MSILEDAAGILVSLQWEVRLLCQNFLPGNLVPIVLSTTLLAGTKVSFLESVGIVGRLVPETGGEQKAIIEEKIVFNRIVDVPRRTQGGRQER